MNAGQQNSTHLCSCRTADGSCQPTAVAKRQRCAQRLGAAACFRQRGQSGLVCLLWGAEACGSPQHLLDPCPHDADSLWEVVQHPVRNVSPQIRKYQPVGLQLGQQHACMRRVWQTAVPEGHMLQPLFVCLVRVTA